MNKKEVMPRDVAKEDDEVLQKQLKLLKSKYAAMVRSGDKIQELIGVTFIRSLLSIERDPPIDAVIVTGILKELATFLKRDDDRKLQFETLWVWSNIASGSSTNVGEVLKANVVPEFVRLIQSKDEDVSAQAIWALGNLAGESAKVRDYVLSCQGLQPVIFVLTRRQGCSLSLLRNATWCMSNLCRGKPLVKFADIACVYPVLGALLNRVTDIPQLGDVCWACSYLSEGPNNRIEALIENNIFPKIVLFAEHASSSIQSASLRTIGNVVTGSDKQTNYAIHCGVIPVLKRLMKHSKINIRKECMWAISNLIAGSRNTLEQVFKHGIMRHVFYVLNPNSNSPVGIKKEATWALQNAICFSKVQEIHLFVKWGAIGILRTAISSSDGTVAVLGLDGIYEILNAGRRIGKRKKITNPYLELFGKLGIMKLRTILLTTLSKEVQKKCSFILKTFFQTMKIEKEYFDMKVCVQFVSKDSRDRLMESETNT